jgi:hypothetical protein
MRSNPPHHVGNAEMWGKLSAGYYRISSWARQTNPLSAIEHQTGLFYKDRVAGSVFKMMDHIVNRTTKWRRSFIPNRKPKT